MQIMTIVVAQHDSQRSNEPNYVTGVTSHFDDVLLCMTGLVDTCWSCLTN